MYSQVSVVSHQCFVVFTEPPLQVEPTEGPFHDPPAGQHLEGVLPRRTAHQFQAPTAHQLGPLHQLAAVGPIGPDHLQSVLATHQAFQYQPSTVAILNVGGMHYRRQQQPQSIHHNVTFASLYPLARVVTSRPPFSVVFTDWLSMTAALGLAARPWDCRRLERRASLALCQVLSLRQVRK